MNAMRVSLVEKNGEIRGTVSSDGDGVFRLEALALIVEALAKDTGVPPTELLNDLRGVLQ